jgi:hypothetical protein
MGVGDPCVEHGLVQGAMPEGPLPKGDRHPCTEQAPRIRMPPAIRAEPNADGGAPPFEATGDAAGREGAAPLHQEMIGAGGPQDRQIRVQCLNRPVAEIDAPIPLEFGVLHAEAAGGEIHILTAQSDELATPEPSIDAQRDDGQTQSSLPRGMHGPRTGHSHPALDGQLRARSLGDETRCISGSRIPSGR